MTTDAKSLAQSAGTTTAGDSRFLPHQCKAFAFSKDIKNSYLAIDMGLGKTFIGIVWALGKKNPTLVIAPKKTAESTWPEEIEKWAPGSSYRFLHGPDKSLRPSADFLVINFEGIKWLYMELYKLYKAGKRIPFNSMIIDEGSMVKSHSTKRFKYLRDIRHFCVEGILMLGGTPSPNSLLDLWAQMFLLDGGKSLGTSYTGYRAKFFQPMTKWGTVNESTDWQELERSKWELKDPKFEEVIHKCASKVMFRLDAGDYVKLPGITYNSIMVDLPPSVHKLMKRAVKNRVIEADDHTITIENASKLSMVLRQLTQGALYLNAEKEWKEYHKAKVEALRDIMAQTNGYGVLCPIQFRFELEILQREFPGTPYVAGGTKDFASILARWNKGLLPLLLVHPLSMSHGVNAQMGSHIVVWYAMTWSLEQYLQLNKRVHRMGQKNAVVIHHLIARNTIDEFILEALHSKRDIQAALLDYIKQVNEAKYE